LRARKDEYVVITILASLVSLALGAKLLLRLLVHRDEPLLALVVEGRRAPSADSNAIARRT
jgi:hypothetical protein